MVFLWQNNLSISVFIEIIFLHPIISEAPFDAIHVGAAAATVPQALVNQLKPGGRLFIPVGAEYGEQYLEQIDKQQDGSITRKRLMGVHYVPLVNKEHKT